MKIIIHSLQEKFGDRKVTQAKLLYSNPIKFSVAFAPKRGTKSTKAITIITILVKKVVFY